MGILNDFYYSIENQSYIMQYKMIYACYIYFYVLVWQIIGMSNIDCGLHNFDNDVDSNDKKYTIYIFFSRY